ncbi:MAG: hypothetical protein WC742_15490 [Gallionellaceae bacterium]
MHASTSIVVYFDGENNSILPFFLNIIWDVHMIFNHGIKLAIVSSVLLCACASPTVVQAVKPGDGGLSCAQLQNEYADAERFRVEADKEKSVTGGNVVRALLFWPAILGTAANANEAIAAADTRKVHLANQMSQRNCGAQSASQSVDSSSAAPVQVASATPQNKEAKLTELKQLYESKLILKETYEARQKSILDSQL